MDQFSRRRSLFAHHHHHLQHHHHHSATPDIPELLLRPNKYSIEAEEEKDKVSGAEKQCSLNSNVAVEAENLLTAVLTATTKSAAFKGTAIDYVDGHNNDNDSKLLKDPTDLEQQRLKEWYLMQIIETAESKLRRLQTQQQQQQQQQSNERKLSSTPAEQSSITSRHSQHRDAAHSSADSAKFKTSLLVSETQPEAAPINHQEQCKIDERDEYEKRSLCDHQEQRISSSAGSISQNINQNLNDNNKSNASTAVVVNSTQQDSHKRKSVGSWTLALAQRHELADRKRCNSDNSEGENERQAISMTGGQWRRCSGDKKSNQKEEQHKSGDFSFSSSSSTFSSSSSSSSPADDHHFCLQHCTNEPNLHLREQLRQVRGDAANGRASQLLLISPFRQLALAKVAFKRVGELNRSAGSAATPPADTCSRSPLPVSAELSSPLQWQFQCSTDAKKNNLQQQTIAAAFPSVADHCKTCCLPAATKKQQSSRLFKLAHSARLQFKRQLNTCMSSCVSRSRCSAGCCRSNDGRCCKAANCYSKTLSSQRQQQQQRCSSSSPIARTWRRALTCAGRNAYLAISGAATSGRLRLAGSEEAIIEPEDIFEQQERRRQLWQLNRQHSSFDTCSSHEAATLAVAVHTDDIRSEAVKCDESNSHPFVITTLNDTEDHHFDDHLARSIQVFNAKLAAAERVVGTLPEEELRMRAKRVGVTAKRYEELCAQRALGSSPCALTTDAYLSTETTTGTTCRCCIDDETSETGELSVNRRTGLAKAEPWSPRRKSMMPQVASSQQQQRRCSNHHLLPGPRRKRTGSHPLEKRALARRRSVTLKQVLQGSSPPANQQKRRPAQVVIGHSTNSSNSSSCGEQQVVQPQLMPSTGRAARSSSITAVSRRRSQVVEALLSRWNGSAANQTGAATNAVRSSSQLVQCSPQLRYNNLIPADGYRIAVMGPSGVGKTSIIQRFLFNSFSQVLKPTVHDIYFIRFQFGKTKYNISVLDTPGSFYFPAMKRLWINSSDAFILVGSVDQPDSLAKIKKLRQSILEERELVCKGVDANEQAADLPSSDMLKTTVDRQNSNNSQATQITSTRSPNSPQPFQHLLSKLLEFSHHRRKRHHELIQQLPDPQIRSNSTTTIQHNNKTNPSSARRTSTWSAEEVLRTRRIRNPPVVIVWNKQDLPQDKQQFSVYELEAISLVEWNYGFVRASAYDNMKIEDIFRQVLEQARQPPELGECMIRKRHISQQPPK